LLSPDAAANAVENLHQCLDVNWSETTTEITHGGRVGDALGAQSVGMDLVVASQFDLFDPLAAGEGVEGNVQNMVGLMIREMRFKEVEIGVDVGDQAGPARQKQHGADVTGTQPLDTIGQFLVDIGGAHHGLGPLGPRRIDESAVNSSPVFRERSRLASVAFFSESSSHSAAP
jgi:hypothetical protein